MKSKKLIIYALIIFFALSWMKQYKTIEQQKNTIAHQEDLISEYDDALDEANDNIDDANSIIEDAQGAAWSSYEDMGYALDNLYTVDTVSKP